MKKNETNIVKEGRWPIYTGSSSASAINIPGSKLGGGIFVCSNYTIDECYRKRLFGLPVAYLNSYVEKIAPGLPLFLFNYSDRTLHGIFEATGYGQKNIDPFAWTASGSGITPFPAQVKFRIKKQCQPLGEDDFSRVLVYYDDNHIRYVLDEEQTDKLVSLFSPLPDVSSTTSATVSEEVIRRNNRANAHRNEQEPKDELDLPQVPQVDDQVPLGRLIETEMKSWDLRDKVVKLSQDLEEIKEAHSKQSDKIRSLEQKLEECLRSDRGRCDAGLEGFGK